MQYVVGIIKRGALNILQECRLHRSSNFKSKIDFKATFGDLPERFLLLVRHSLPSKLNVFTIRIAMKRVRTVQFLYIYISIVFLRFPSYVTTIKNIVYQLFQYNLTRKHFWSVAKICFKKSLWFRLMESKGQITYRVEI